MNREQAIEKLKALQESDDTESAHAQADRIIMNLLTELGYYDVVEEYDKIYKWYA